MRTLSTVTRIYPALALDKGDGLWLSHSGKLLEPFLLPCFAEILAIALAELGPLGRIVAEPLPQIMHWR